MFTTVVILKSWCIQTPRTLQMMVICNFYVGKSNSRGEDKKRIRRLTSDLHWNVSHCSMPNYVFPSA